MWFLRWLWSCWERAETDTDVILSDDDLKNWGQTVARVRAEKGKGHASES